MARPKPPALTSATADDIELALYEAMRRGDVDGLMALWSDDDEICCIHPGGKRLVGASAIRASFEAIFGNGAIDAEPHRVRRLESHSSAVHSVLEKIRVRSSEGEQLAWVVATNVYLKSADGWRLVAHHASPGTAGEAHELVEPSSSSTLH
jgi:ketosteroid isomerase-like protein